MISVMQRERQGVSQPGRGLVVPGPPYLQSTEAVTPSDVTNSETVSGGLGSFLLRLTVVVAISVGLKTVAITTTLGGVMILTYLKLRSVR